MRKVKIEDMSSVYGIISSSPRLGREHWDRAAAMSAKSHPALMSSILTFLIHIVRFSKLEKINQVKW